MPSLAQLDEAVRAFIAERPHDIYTVVVDATFEHRIDASERKLYDEALANNELIVTPAGTVGRGDRFILEVADRAGATVLSNDSFQEFHGDYKWLFDAGRLIGGRPGARRRLDLRRADPGAGPEEPAGDSPGVAQAGGHGEQGGVGPHAGAEVAAAGEATLPRAPRRRRRRRPPPRHRPRAQAPRRGRRRRQRRRARDRDRRAPPTDRSSRSTTSCPSSPSSPITSPAARSRARSWSSPATAPTCRSVTSAATSRSRTWRTRHRAVRARSSTRRDAARSSCSRSKRRAEASTSRCPASVTSRRRRPAAARAPSVSVTRHTCRCDRQGPTGCLVERRRSGSGQGPG